MPFSTSGPAKKTGHEAQYYAGSLTTRPNAVKWKQPEPEQNESGAVWWWEHQSTPYQHKKDTFLMSAKNSLLSFTLIEKIKYVFGHPRLVATVYVEALLERERWAAKLAALEDSCKSRLSVEDTALLAVGNSLPRGQKRTTTNEIRQFGLMVAYALVEAALSEQPTLPACFTADDLVLASDVLAGEMSREWR